MRVCTQARELLEDAAELEAHDAQQEADAQHHVLKHAKTSPLGKEGGGGRAAGSQPGSRAASPPKRSGAEGAAMSALSSFQLAGMKRATTSGNVSSLGGPTLTLEEQQEAAAKLGPDGLPRVDMVTHLAELRERVHEATLLQVRLVPAGHTAPPPSPACPRRRSPSLSVARRL